jgi:DNA-binding transcriptional ArsR family regulator
MVQYRAAGTFAALGDPTRAAIVERLARGPATVSALAEPFAMSLPAVSKHLRVLESAGVVERRKRGRATVCSLRAAALREAATWLERRHRMWERRLDRLAAHLEGRP